MHKNRCYTRLSEIQFDRYDIYRKEKFWGQIGRHYEKDWQAKLKTSMGCSWDVKHEEGWEVDSIEKALPSWKSD